MADSKISQLTPITGANLLDSDEFIVARAGTFENFAVTRAEMFQSTPAIATSELTTDTATVQGNITVTGTVDGRDVAADGSKLDSIETNADVTDTANVTAAGALMDSELTSEASVKALDQGVATTDSPDFAGLAVDTDTLFVDASTDSVGINNASPSASLDVTGDAKVSGDLTVDTDTFYVDSANNRVGIGTSSLSKKLEIHGVTNNDGIRIISANDTNNNYIFFGDTSSNAQGRILYDHASDRMSLFTNNSEAMRIDSSGNVGIGTSSPDHKLHVQGSNAGGEFKALELWNNTTDTAGSKTSLNMPVYNGTSGLSISQFSSLSDSYNAVISTGQGGSSLIFESGSRSEAMRIDSSGNVLVGTTNVSPGASNTVTGVSLRDQSKVYASSDDLAALFNRNNTGLLISMRRAGSEVGDISVTSSSTSYNTSSDERLKENIADAQPASDLIDGIQVREFDWKADGEHQRYGMVAQELETVAPEAVTKGETEDDMWSVDYSKLVPMLVKEIQDLRKRVEELEATA